MTELESLREQLRAFSAARDWDQFHLGIDPIAAAQRKLLANAVKYPVAKARGNSKKYTEP